MANPPILSCLVITEEKHNNLPTNRLLMEKFQCGITWTNQPTPDNFNFPAVISPECINQSNLHIVLEKFTGLNQVQIKHFYDRWSEFIKPQIDKSTLASYPNQTKNLSIYLLHEKKITNESATVVSCNNELKCTRCTLPPIVLSTFNWQLFTLMEFFPSVINLTVVVCSNQQRTMKYFF